MIYLDPICLHLPLPENFQHILHAVPSLSLYLSLSESYLVQLVLLARMLTDVDLLLHRSCSFLS